MVAIRFLPSYFTTVVGPEDCLLCACQGRISPRSSVSLITDSVMAISRQSLAAFGLAACKDPYAHRKRWVEVRRRALESVWACQRSELRDMQTRVSVGVSNETHIILSFFTFHYFHCVSIRSCTLQSDAGWVCCWQADNAAWSCLHYHNRVDVNLGCVS